MAKINFTKEHFNKMCKGLLAMLLNNGVVTTKLGTPINVVELHWEGNTLVGKIEIITSPGFRKFGIIVILGSS